MNPHLTLHLEPAVETPSQCVTTTTLACYLGALSDAEVHDPRALHEYVSVLVDAAAVEMEAPGPDATIVMLLRTLGRLAERTVSTSVEIDPPMAAHLDQLLAALLAPTGNSEGR